MWCFVQGLNVQIVPSTFEENLDKSQFSPEAYVVENARQKALEVCIRCKIGIVCDILFGVDTRIIFSWSIFRQGLLVTVYITRGISYPFSVVANANRILIPPVRLRIACPASPRTWSWAPTQSWCVLVTVMLLASAACEHC